MSVTSATADLAVAVTAHDSMRTMPRLLESVSGLASRIVVVDSGSKDGTVKHCSSRGAEVIHREWAGYAAQKQFALDQCREHRWVLLLDSDESLEPALRESIRQVLADDDARYDGWELNRKVWFLGGWLHYTFQPDWVLRLVRGGRGRISSHAIHERLTISGRVGQLDGVLRHDSWVDLSDLAHRQIRYAAITAQDVDVHAGGRPWHLLLNPPAALFKQLVLKRGMLDGWRGLICAGMTANYTMLKHAFIAASRNINRGQKQ